MNRSKKQNSDITEEARTPLPRLLRCIDRRHGKKVFVFSRVPTATDLEIFRRLDPNLNYRVELVPSAYVKRMEENQRLYENRKAQEEKKSPNLNRNVKKKHADNKDNIKESSRKRDLDVELVENNKEENLPLAERFVALDKRFGKHVAMFVRELFPELTELERAEAEGRASWVSRIGENPAQEPERLSLPEKAPEAWKDRPSGRLEDPPSFLLRVYRPWLDKGLTRAHIRALDRSLYNALATHAHRHGVPEELQDFFASPSKLVDEELRRYGITEPRQALERIKDDRRDAERLYLAARRRQRGPTEPSR